MLLTRMSSGPKTRVGLTIAYESPDSATACSSSALPRKYGRGEPVEAFVTLKWTKRPTFARRAAHRRTRVFATVRAKVDAPRSKRIQ
jgi:hypothetical protein